MKIQCDCGKFEAELLNFPKNSPRRVVCYCTDCQSYLEKINRTDLMDEYGGTEVVPVYPDDFNIIRGEEYLCCNKLSPRGLSRFSVTCCHSPIGNTKEQFPWLGLIYKGFTNADPTGLESLGPVRSRIKGKSAKGKPPFQISEDLGFKDVLVVLPFVLKGLLLKKYQHSPFFKEDGRTSKFPIKEL